ncbi:hypothetical protein DL93DRAFT_2096509 [Clavulina sp. PMI_390]|nr:hypothetical protein DL93DRAFT_2096509 [Clavulina sp. PMI_390]
MGLNLLYLPNELLWDIASLCITRHPHEGYAIRNDDVVALSSTCRRLRAVTYGTLSQDLVITSERQLKAVAKIIHTVAVHVREVNLFLDVDFYASFKTFAARAPSAASPFMALSTLLSQATYLQALRIRVTQNHGERSPWCRPFLLRPDGIPVGNILESCLPHFSFPNLRILELDAFSDIKPLLRRTPNLQRLRLTQPAGFVEWTNAELVSAVRHVPKLSELVYSASSLRLQPRPPSGAGPDAVTAFGLPIALGRTLPQLQFLDLRSSWYEPDAVFVPNEEPLDLETLCEILRYLPHAQQVHLPNFLGDPKEIATLQFAAASDRSRGAAIQKLAIQEQQAVLEASAFVPNLRTISFLRPSASTSGSDQCAEYTISSLSRSLRRPSRIHERVILAKHREVDARPLSRSHTETKGWNMPKIQKAGHLSSRDHRTTATMLVEAGGRLLGEASRMLHYSALAAARG